MKRAWEVVLLGLMAAIVIDVLYATVQPLIPYLIGALVALLLFSVWYRHKRWW
jgi:L-lactate permease